MRSDGLAPGDQAPFQPEHLLELCVVRFLEHAVLELVDAVVELGELGEEAVDQRVDDAVERQCRLERRRAALGDLATQVGEGGAVVVVHGEQVLPGDEAVHLDEAVHVGVGAVGDEVDVPVVLFQLGPLAEVLGVLDGQGVEAEGLSQQPELLGRRLMQVEPEELTSVEVSRDDVARDRRVRPVLVDEEALVMARHRSLRLHACRSAGGAPVAPSFAARRVVPRPRRLHRVPRPRATRGGACSTRAGRFVYTAVRHKWELASTPPCARW